MWLRPDPAAPFPPPLPYCVKGTNPGSLHSVSGQGHSYNLSPCVSLSRPLAPFVLQVLILVAFTVCQGKVMIATSKPPSLPPPSLSRDRFPSW